MGQADVAEILTKNYPRWLSPHDLTDMIDINRNSLRRSLRALTTRDEVEVKTVQQEKSKARWITYYRIKN